MSQTPSPQRHRGTESAKSFPAFLCASVSLWLVIFLAVSTAALAAEVRILVQSSPLAGFQYHAGETLWQDMREGDRLALVREADNPHDGNAVRVEWRGQKLGYLPRAENRAVAAALDRGEPVDARIAKLREHRNPWQRVLIEVFVVL
ncbi:MAG: HIRAN domain-containing protein [Sulfuritalea sp.]|jgi:hypothetical protein|nr:HIRAN domain-containing protein [Sulfuritalea sp.]